MWVIFSFEETEDDSDNTPMFWNKNEGWTTLGSATVYSDEEMKGTPQILLPYGSQWIYLGDFNQNVREPSLAYQISSFHFDFINKVKAEIVRLAWDAKKKIWGKKQP